MREIKFRAWWGEEMFYSPMKEGKYAPDIFDDIYIKPDGRIFDFNSYTEINGGILEENNSGIILMQFTGLKDKNGVEIYEGDIWKRDQTICQVIFEFSSWNFKMVSGPIQYPTFYSNASTGEIIGNIYENQELLKG